MTDTFQTELPAGRSLIPGVFRGSSQERVIYGRDAAEAVAQEAGILGKSRVFLTTVDALAGPDDLPARIAKALGSRFVGVFDHVSPHAPRSCVLAVAAAARAAGADLIVGIGGGSVMDTTKAALLCLWEGLTTEAGFDPFLGRFADPSRPPDNSDQMIRMLAVPTMFSAAEFTTVAGVTDPKRRVKDILQHPLFAPQVVVLDPAATLSTPVSLLAVTGMKAVDHAVEASCALTPPPLARAASEAALPLLYNGLPQLGEAADNIALRMDCQFGMWLSIYSVTAGAPVGASHALGHVIGAYGVPHAHTTGTLLPAVLRWNFEANAEQQDRAGALIGVTGADLSDAIHALAQRLGAPTRLRDVGISRAQLDSIAEKSMHDPSMRTNPRRISAASQVREILDLAW